MFFKGDLQSGIALALSESKSVACFIKGTSLHPLLEFDSRLIDWSKVTMNRAPYGKKTS